jgi:hypothetical protein
MLYMTLAVFARLHRHETAISMMQDMLYDHALDIVGPEAAPR